MRKILAQAVAESLQKASENGNLPKLPEDLAVSVEQPRNPEHGDFATNIAMTLARVAKMPPRAIAEAIVANIPTESGIIASAEIAGPGFINLRLKNDFVHQILPQIRKKNSEYGRSDSGQGKRVLVEFVSANPTGPLHVGHGRGAVTGDAVASLLQAAGYEVTREYYVNDVGNQMNMLGQSLHARVQQEAGMDTALPENGYQGAYLADIAKNFLASEGEESAKLEYPNNEKLFIDYAKGAILKEIQQDLAALGISFDNWFSEQTLHDSNRVHSAVEDLQTRDIIFEREGALLLRSTQYGDDNDRVVVRADGRPTYFAADIAYHREKFERGFDTAINVWGADHHGYLPRVRAALEASGIDPNLLEIIFIQFVGLLRNGEQVKMSTRSGEFEELRSIIDECGGDAVRFFFLMRKSDSQQEFDLEVAKKRSLDNPVFYVQYGHARLCSILRKAQSEGVAIPEETNASTLAALSLPEERAIMMAASEFPHIVQRAAEAREPHQVVFYLMDTIKLFHSYYTRYKGTERVLSEDPLKTAARLAMVDALRIVISNALRLLKVAAPERMQAPEAEATD